MIPGSEDDRHRTGWAADGRRATQYQSGRKHSECTDSGTEALWTTAPMTEAMDVVGAPTVTLRVAAPGQPVVFAKLYDVAPDGTSSLINGLIAPIRISDPSQPVPVTMPAIVHRFEPGHSVRLAITGGDISFRGGLQGMPVTIFADGSGPLELPVVG